MKPKIQKLSKKISLLLGILAITMATHAQTLKSDNNAPDSAHRRLMQSHRDHGDGYHHEGQRDAQGDHSFQRPGKRHHGPRLHFTPEQRQQMQTLNREYRKKSADLFQNDQLTLGEYKSQLIALQKERKARLQGLLTQQQKDELAQWKKRAAENAQVKAAARLERMKIRLNLSDDQVRSLKSGQASLRTQFQSIHNNDNLLPRQKRERIKDLAEKRKEAIKAVLTPEQMSKFENMHHKRGFGRGPGQEEETNDNGR